MNDILQIYIFQNSVADYATALLILIIGLTATLIFKNVVLRKFKEVAKKTTPPFDDFIAIALERTLIPLLYFGSLYIALRVLNLDHLLSRSIEVIGLVLITFFVIKFSIAVIALSLETFVKKDELKKKNYSGILTVVKIALWIFGAIFLLDNLGFKISTVIAGLGIGGIAIALAAQSLLGDLFSYFSIFFDKPFEIGDFIIIGDYLGEVEHIGIKTTRLKSLSGEQLIFSNSDLTNSRVRNYKRMDKRRVVFKFGVTYQTPTSKLKEIPKMIRSIVNNVKDTTCDRAHFFEYGDFSLVFEVVYYVLGNDYNIYMDKQQEINFAIKEEFEKQNIEFAYPTQTVILNK